MLLVVFICFHVENSIKKEQKKYFIIAKNSNNLKDRLVLIILLSYIA